MSNDLFVIYTPYQLISAVNVAKKLQVKNANCLVMHKCLLTYKKQIEKYFHGKIYYFEELTEHLYMENIPIINKSFVRINILIRIICAKKFVNKNKLFQEKYDELFVPSDEAICRIIYRETLRVNPLVNLNLIDDGIGTYVNDLFVRKRWISQIVYSLLLTHKYAENIKRIFCYYPELLEDIPFDIEVYKIQYDKEIDIFNQAVKDHIDKYIGKKVIFLDQGIFNEQSKKVLAYLSEIFGKDNILIKKHPRINGLDFYQNYNVVDDGLPFEAIVSECNCSSCLIISHSSTACITPYLLFGLKPNVIFYYCIDNEEYKTRVLNFIYKINEIEKGEYISVPKSMDDFIQDVQKKIKNIEAVQSKTEN